MSRRSRNPFFLAGLYFAGTACGLVPGAAALADEAPSSPPEAEVSVKEVPAGAAPSAPFDTSKLPPVVKNLERHGVEVVGELETPADIQAYAGITQQQPLAIYLTPDEKHVIVGTMMDAQGADVTQGALEEATIGPWTTRSWDALSDSAWIADGSADAKRVIYMITDPNCPFCHKFWQQARPWVESGKVQLRHVLVGVLTESSRGKAAAILSADEPERALLEHEKAGPDHGVKPLAQIPEEISEQLDKNRALMEEMQIQGTPGIFYFDDTGKLQIQRGAPLDEDLEQILGKKN